MLVSTGAGIRDLSRVAVYNLNATGNRDGSEGAYAQNLAAAAFEPSLTTNAP